MLQKRLELCKPNIESNKDLNLMLCNLKKYFKKRNCYLMPHPGTSITKKEFNGNLNQLDTEFIEFSNEFYKKTLESIDLNKHRNDVFKNGEILFNMFSEYVKAYDSNSFPNLESITKVTIYLFIIKLFF